MCRLGEVPTEPHGVTWNDQCWEERGRHGEHLLQHTYPTSPGQMLTVWGAWATYLLLSTVQATEDGLCGRDCVPSFYIHSPSHLPHGLLELE